MDIGHLDEKFISFFRKISNPAARIAIFIVYFWFGMLKVLGLSPATPLVLHLFSKTMSGISFDTFIILFGLFEVFIGVLFLFPKMTRVVIPLLFIHLFMTALPLFMLPHEVWTRIFVPTLEGQYIIKNLVIIACAISISSSLTPLNYRGEK